MILKCLVIFFLLQVLIVEQSTCRQLSLLQLRENLSTKSSPFNLSKRGCKRRRRRHLSTTVSLLWPQVVGPVEQGVITESDYNEIPKTLLEYRLDFIRKKAEQEEENRLMVREYLKKLTEAQDNFYGFSYGNSRTNGYYT